MKARFMAALLMGALLPITAKQVYADTNIKIIVDGILQNPVRRAEVVNGRILAPVRAIWESIGASVGWDAVSKQISVYSHEHYALMRIGDLNIRSG